MDNKQTSLEMIAPTVEEAIQRGLKDLGLTRNEVEVEVLDSGSKGLFGLGFRQARIRLTIREAKTASAETLVFSPEPTAPVTERPPVSKPVEEIKSEVLSTEVKAEAGEKLVSVDEDTLQTAREVVDELLIRMNFHARITARVAEPEDTRDRPMILVDVRGDDLSVLIGPHAETLNALQYIAGLIVSKEMGRSVPLVIDVEGYRVRRAQQIRQLARRIAEQAERTGRRQMLEPMPANERRLVHIELRNNPSVTTESVGEDPHRKVTIIPKEEG